MRRYDVCELKRRGRYGFGLVVQSNALDDLPTRVVIPLAANVPAQTIPLLNPKLTIDRNELVLLTEQMAHVSTKALGKVVGNASKHDYAISRALDLLFKGF